MSLPCPAGFLTTRELCLLLPQGVQIDEEEGSLRRKVSGGYAVTVTRDES